MKLLTPLVAFILAVGVMSAGTAPLSLEIERGRAYAQTGETDAARASWEAVMKAYPDSDAARLAKQDLDRINRPAPSAPAGR